jgi:2Fe-2S ferredoxin
VIRISFVEADGTTHQVEAEVGQKLMQVAVDHLIPGILAECGGWCACATCHVYADGERSDRLPAPSEEEKALLEGVLHLRDSSRLSCQVVLTEEMDGLVLHLPPPAF